MASIYDCNQLPTEHYPVSRNGPHGSSGTAILLVFTETPLRGLQGNIDHMETFFQGLNLRTNIICIFSPQALEHALSVITKPEFYRDRHTTQLTADAWEARVLKEDSLCFVGVIARGDFACSQLSNGDYVNDVSIEEFFNEECCVLLRGKPKLFLYFKYFDSSIEGAGATELRHKAANLHTGGIDWRNPTTSTNMNFLSFYIYEFGIPAFQTENTSSKVLQRLHPAYQANTTDIVSFFREFFNEMIDLQTPFKRQRLPCVCQTARYRMRSSLFLLPPQPAGYSEEQDLESCFSETLSNYSSLSITPRDTTPQTAYSVEPRYNHSAYHTSPQATKPRASYQLSTQSPSLRSLPTPLSPRHKQSRYTSRKKMDMPHGQQYRHRTQSYTNACSYPSPHWKPSSRPQIAPKRTAPERYHGCNARTNNNTNNNNNNNKRRWKKRIRLGSRKRTVRTVRDTAPTDSVQVAACTRV